MYCPLPELGFNYNDYAGTGNNSLPVGVQYPRAWKYKVKWQLQPSPAESILAIHPKCFELEAHHRKQGELLNCPHVLGTVKKIVFMKHLLLTHGAQLHGIPGLEGMNTDCLICYYPVAYREASLPLDSNRWVHWPSILIWARDAFAAVWFRSQAIYQFI